MSRKIVNEGSNFCNFEHRTIEIAYAQLHIIRNSGCKFECCTLKSVGERLQTCLCTGIQMDGWTNKVRQSLMIPEYQYYDISPLSLKIKAQTNKMPSLR